MVGGREVALQPGLYTVRLVPKPGESTLASYRFSGLTRNQTRESSLPYVRVRVRYGQSKVGLHRMVCDVFRAVNRTGGTDNANDFFASSS